MVKKACISSLLHTPSNKSIFVYHVSLLLVNARNNSVLDNAAVLFPVRAIFPCAPRVISPASLNQENGHKDRICPGQKVVDSTDGADTV